MRNRNLYGTILILFTASILLVGCAATNSYMEDTPAKTEPSQGGTENSELDQLLGSGDQNADETVNEDDVLRLLGVNDESKAGSKSESALAPAEQSQSETTLASDASGANTAETRAASAQPNEQNASAPAQSAARENTAIPAWKSDSFTDRYQEALQTYRSRQYRESIQKFEALLATNSKHPLSDNCQYWIGEAYYDQGNFPEAILAFQKVFTFPGSNKDDSAQLKLGLCYVKLNDKPKAKDELQKLVNNYPNSEFIGIAKRFIAQIEGSAPSP
jgi:tol-pal system protein YbgF